MLLILGLMLVITVFAILYCVGIIDEISVVVVVMGCVFLAIILIILPCLRAEVHYEIVAFQQVKKDINNARMSKLDPIERASLTSTIIENNIWLAKKNLRNAGFWDIFIPDEVDLLKKLQ